MDNITKFLQKLISSEQNMLLEIMQKILAWNLDWFDVKALTGKHNMFRVRKWKFRIVFEKVWEKYVIVDLNYRGNIYK